MKTSLIIIFVWRTYLDTMKQRSAIKYYCVINKIDEYISMTFR